jgi:hypothetical protein
LKDGEQACSGDTGYKRCANGQLIEENCPTDAKCVASPSVKQVICRQIIRNADTRTGNHQEGASAQRRF